MNINQLKDKIRNEIKDLETDRDPFRDSDLSKGKENTLLEILTDLDSLETLSTKQSSITIGHIEAILDLINKKDYYGFKVLVPKLTPNTELIAVVNKDDNILCTGSPTEVFNYVLGFNQALAGFGK